MITRILTIDWDYFFLAPLSVRDNNFPDILNGEVGTIPDNNKWLEVIPPKELKVDWSSISYLEKAINSIPEVYLPKFFAISENHGEMFRVAVSAKEEHPYPPLEITNIDFHHDYYYTNGNRLCCDNWMRIVKERFPDTTFRWCPREDSVTETFGFDVCKGVPIKIVDFSTIMTELIEGEFDYIHLCRSDLYSPPIADEGFDKVRELLSNRCNFTIKLDDMVNRKYLIEKYIERLMNYEK